MPDSRELIVNNANFNGETVLYVMSRDQRADDNHALLAAQHLANSHGVRLYVLFVLDQQHQRPREHTQFMLDGLKHVADGLAELGIPFILAHGQPQAEIERVAHELNAGALFFDFSPLKEPRALVEAVAKNFPGSVTVVDTHNIIPLWVASDKKEFAAHTMRNKVHKKLEQWLVSPAQLAPQPAPSKSGTSLSFDDAQKIVDGLPSSGISVHFTPGERAAREQLERFIETIATYAVKRNDIAVDHQSGLSPYLHFGQISALRVALEVIQAVNKPPLLFQKAKLVEAGDTPNKEDGMNALLEELIVRKELADNFCFFAEDYRSLKGAPEWAQQTLAQHAKDVRDFVYTRAQWESADTHDAIWNAAQTELTKTGKLHGYMRMYWAKKLLEWSATPEGAVQTAIYLNDTYSIDGLDPNGYVGVLWSIAGLHDRPWFERPVYGKVRYMNSAGLQRKFKVDEYLVRVAAL